MGKLKNIYFCMHSKPTLGARCGRMVPGRIARSFCPFLKSGEKCFCIVDYPFKYQNYSLDKELTYKYTINLGQFHQIVEYQSGYTLAEFIDKDRNINSLELGVGDEELQIYGEEFLRLLLSSKCSGDFTVMFGEKVTALPPWEAYTYRIGFDNKGNRDLIKNYNIKIKCGSRDKLYLFNDGEKIRKLSRKVLEKKYKKQLNIPDVPNKFKKELYMDYLKDMAKIEGLNFSYPDAGMCID